MFAFDRLVFEIFDASDAQHHDILTSQHGQKPPGDQSVHLLTFILYEYVLMFIRSLCFLVSY